MGLDMYLTRKKYIGGKYDFNEVKGVIDISRQGIKIPVDMKKIQYIEEEVAYWRKANQMHKWFVDNVQGGKDDCALYYVDTSDLEKLLNLCKEVKEKAILVDGQITNGAKLENGEWKPIYENGKIIQNKKEIARILPVQSGFFFGDTEYDEYYMEDIDYTVEILEEILKEDEELNKQGIYPEYYYRASW